MKEIFKKIPIHPTFFLLLIWFIINNNLSTFFLFLIVVFSHEFGHFITAKKLGYKLDSFYIAPYGVSLNYKEKAFDSKDEIIIALAGPFINIFISLIIVTAWWIFPDSYNFTYDLVNQSLILGLFNLLPCYPLDGGRVFCGLLSKYTQRKKTVSLICKLNYFFSMVFIVAFIYSCFHDFNPTLILSAIFLILGNLDFKNESKYLPISLYKKKMKNFSKPSLIYVNESVTLSQLIKHVEINKFTVFVVNLNNDKTKFLDEKTLFKLTLKYTIDTSLSEIFK